MLMKIASWNVNSLNVRLDQVIEWLGTEKPDILALQETKTTDDKFPESRFNECGYKVIYSGQKTYNGVAIAVRKEHKITNIIKDIPDLEDVQRRIIAADIGGIRVLNLYVVNGQEVGSEKYTYKMDWLGKVRNFIESDAREREYYVILGDFNIAPTNSDVYDPEVWKDKILCSAGERRALEEIKSLGFVDTFRQFEQPENAFSWWDYRSAAFRRNQGMRIDLILANTPLSARCAEATIDRNPRTWERPSDHTPVVSVFDLAGSVNPKQKVL